MRAVYAGSFDPVTNGHLWIIEQASKLFNELFVIVGNNIHKNYLFSIEQRIQLLHLAIDNFQPSYAKDVNMQNGNYDIIYENSTTADKFIKSNQIVIGQLKNNGLIINYAKEIGADYVVRGIRNTNDYEYERSMRYVNADLNESVNTIFLMPPKIFSDVSSSVIKSLIGFDGWEDVGMKYLPKSVFMQLKSWYNTTTI